MEIPYTFLEIVQMVKSKCHETISYTLDTEVIQTGASVVARMSNCMVVPGCPARATLLARGLLLAHIQWSAPRLAVPVRGPHVYVAVTCTTRIK